MNECAICEKNNENMLTACLQDHWLKPEYCPGFCYLVPQLIKSYYCQTFLNYHQSWRLWLKYVCFQVDLRNNKHNFVV